MACVDEELQKPNFKHFCRVCKKGFMCGRALGGHMRAHGIGDETTNNVDDDDEASDWEDKHGGSDHKKMYQLRANPNRLKSTKVCENCGKEFLSWKSFLEHGKYCGSDDGDDDQYLVSSPGSGGEEYDIGERKGYGWSKRKRSLRTKVGTFTSTYNSNTYSSEQEDLLLAKWLIDLANGRVDPLTVEPEESCASASKEEERRNPIMAYLNTLDLVNKDRDLEHRRKSDFFILPSLDKAKRTPKGLFECKACKKVFNSHQALGGHRASHKKVKGCFAAKQDQLDHDNDVTTHGDNNHLEGSKSSSYYQSQQGSSLVEASKRKSKIHECSICHRVFSTGQALGGHKRCHWITSNSQADHSSIFTPKFHFHNPLEQINKSSALEKQDPLDLNIPPDEDMSRIRQERPWNIINSLEVSTDIHLHPWSSTNSDHEKKETKDNVVYHKNRDQNEDDNVKNRDNSHNNNNNNSTHKNNGVRQDNATQIINVEDDDEADSKSKLAKLSDLNDINTISGNPSQWLQVGIGPTTEAKADS
ncbi:Zinc finger protein ZAT3 [Capsicum baccatum]|uniref:Zinc finger protein ZAT3 n=1 Tax=Capsicum baccatum TaxID=33114 RepID=A0A2G2XTN1_CAPBA|nr:Zinc finger protein ZAT3 [Capsicum baccatum]